MFFLNWLYIIPIETNELVEKNYLDGNDDDALMMNEIENEIENDDDDPFKKNYCWELWYVIMNIIHL